MNLTAAFGNKILFHLLQCFWTKKLYYVITPLKRFSYVLFLYIFKQIYEKYTTLN